MDGSPFQVHDYTGHPLDPNASLSRLCNSAAQRRLRRQSQLPEFFIDPLSPLPLADAVRSGPAVRYVYLLLASRPYAHETINRNVHALQVPGALEAASRGSRESNLFLVHIDAKMEAGAAEALRAAVSSRPDVYFVRRRRHVVWAGWSMMLVLLDAIHSLLRRLLRSGGRRCHGSNLHPAARAHNSRRRRFSRRIASRLAATLPPATAALQAAPQSAHTRERGSTTGHTIIGAAMRAASTPPPAAPQTRTREGGGLTPSPRPLAGSST